MDKPSNDLIDQFADNELRTSALYTLFAQKLPDHQKFWRQLANEEIGHANEIRSIAPEEADELVESKFSRGVINYVTAFIEEQTERATATELSHLDALNIALKIEQSFVEKRCFEIFMPSDKPISQVMARMDRESGRHLALIRQELGQLETSR